MRRAVRITLIIAGFVLVLSVAGWWALTRSNFVAGLVAGPGMSHSPGDVVDSLDGVYVYYNGAVGSTYGRNTAPDGYNVGLRYQCVEFVKRYYYEHYGHKMPDPWGHARDFFDPTLDDGAWSPRRGLTQHRNGGACAPERGDLIVFGPTVYNAYGHVAIVSAVGGGRVEIIQQNPGPKGESRVEFALENRGGRWHIDNKRALGWLRKTE